jgi:hypothetical protein
VWPLPSCETYLQIQSMQAAVTHMSVFEAVWWL